MEIHSADHCSYPVGHHHEPGSDELHGVGRRITEIILHCSATRAGVPFSIVDIDRWHRQRGWRGCGYHYVILLDGTVQRGRALDEVGAHCAGHNQRSIGICYIGGLDAKGRPTDTRTPEQRRAMERLIEELRLRFPGIELHTHNEFARKACPGFIL